LGGLAAKKGRNNGYLLSFSIRIFRLWALYRIRKKILASFPEIDALPFRQIRPV